MVENTYFCIKKLHKICKLLRMSNDLLLNMVTGYELVNNRMFCSSAFCVIPKNSSSAKVRQIIGEKTSH